RARAALRSPYSAATWSSDAPTSGVNAETSVVRCASKDGSARTAALTASASSSSTGTTAGSASTAPRSSKSRRHAGKRSERAYISVSQLTGGLPSIGARASSPPSRRDWISSTEWVSNAYTSSHSVGVMWVLQLSRCVPSTFCGRDDLVLKLGPYH